jgi:DNA-binding NarL/FixJ family response regulator
MARKDYLLVGRSAGTLFLIPMVRERRGPGQVHLLGHGTDAAIEVALADVPSMVRKGIGLVISGEPGMDLLFEVSSADEAVEGFAGLSGLGRVVLVASLALGGDHDVLWLIRTLRERFPSVRILACGSSAEAASVSRALLSGADGYVDKSCEPERFLDAIRRTAEAETVLEGVPSGALGAIAEAIDRQVELGDVVTAREREVLALAAQGFTARQIGNRLGVAERTVTTHLDHIYRKLGVSGRVAAITAGRQLGLFAAAG